MSGNMYGYARVSSKDQNLKFKFTALLRRFWPNRCRRRRRHVLCFAMKATSCVEARK